MEQLLSELKAQTRETVIRPLLLRKLYYQLQSRQSHHMCCPILLNRLLSELFSLLIAPSTCFPGKLRILAAALVRELAPEGTIPNFFQEALVEGASGARNWYEFCQKNLRVLALEEANAVALANSGALGKGNPGNACSGSSFNANQILGNVRLDTGLMGKQTQSSGLISENSISGVEYFLKMALIELAAGENLILRDILEKMGSCSSQQIEGGTIHGGTQQNSGLLSSSVGGANQNISQQSNAGGLLSHGILSEVLPNPTNLSDSVVIDMHIPNLLKFSSNLVSFSQNFGTLASSQNFEETILTVLNPSCNAACEANVENLVIWFLGFNCFVDKFERQPRNLSLKKRSQLMQLALKAGVEHLENEKQKLILESEKEAGNVPLAGGSGTDARVYHNYNSGLGGPGHVNQNQQNYRRGSFDGRGQQGPQHGNHHFNGDHHFSGDHTAGSSLHENTSSGHMDKVSFLYNAFLNALDSGNRPNNSYAQQQDLKWMQELFFTGTGTGNTMTGGNAGNNVGNADSSKTISIAMRIHALQTLVSHLINTASVSFPEELELILGSECPGAEQVQGWKDHAATGGGETNPHDSDTQNCGQFSDSSLNLSGGGGLINNSGMLPNSGQLGSSALVGAPDHFQFPFYSFLDPYSGMQLSVLQNPSQHTVDSFYYVVIEPIERFFCYVLTSSSTKTKKPGSKKLWQKLFSSTSTVRQVQEIDISACAPGDQFTVLNYSMVYTEDQQLNVAVFSTLYQWLYYVYHVGVLSNVKVVPIRAHNCNSIPAAHNSSIGPCCPNNSTTPHKSSTDVFCAGTDVDGFLPKNVDHMTEKRSPTEIAAPKDGFEKARTDINSQKSQEKGPCSQPVIAAASGFNGQQSAAPFLLQNPVLEPVYTGNPNIQNEMRDRILQKQEMQDRILQKQKQQKMKAAHLQNPSNPNAFKLSQRFREVIIAYCHRILSQGERQVKLPKEYVKEMGTAAGNVSAAFQGSAGNFASNLGQFGKISDKEALDIRWASQLVEAASVEAVRILDLLCILDSSLVSSIFPAIKKVYERTYMTNANNINLLRDANIGLMDSHFDLAGDPGPRFHHGPIGGASHHGVYNSNGSGHRGGMSAQHNDHSQGQNGPNSSYRGGQNNGLYRTDEDEDARYQKN